MLSMLMGKKSKKPPAKKVPTPAEAILKACRENLGVFERDLELATDALEVAKEKHQRAISAARAARVAYAKKATASTKEASSKAAAAQEAARVELERARREAQDAERAVTSARRALAEAEEEVAAERKAGRLGELEEQASLATLWAEIGPRAVRILRLWREILAEARAMDDAFAASLRASREARRLGGDVPDLTTNHLEAPFLAAVVDENPALAGSSRDGWNASEAARFLFHFPLGVGDPTDRDETPLGWVERAIRTGNALTVMAGQRGTAALTAEAQRKALVDFDRYRRAVDPEARVKAARGEGPVPPGPTIFEQLKAWKEAAR